MECVIKEIMGILVSWGDDEWRGSDACVECGRGCEIAVGVKCLENSCALSGEEVEEFSVGGEERRERGEDGGEE